MKEIRTSLTSNIFICIFWTVIVVVRTTRRVAGWGVRDAEEASRVSTSVTFLVTTIFEFIGPLPKDSFDVLCRCFVVLRPQRMMMDRKIGSKRQRYT